MKAWRPAGLALACVAFLVPASTVRGQTTREELYQFRVPIQLTQLSPDLGTVLLQCSSSPSPTKPTSVIPGFTREIEIKNGRLDTTVVIQMKTTVPAGDVGQQGVYKCQISGWPTGVLRDSAGRPVIAPNPLGPDASQLAFRVSPALSTVSTTFRW